MNTTTRGTLSEARASVWLMEQGWEVYLGWGNTSCDIVALRGSEVARIEVKTASPSSVSGKWVVAGCKPHLYDTLLIVYPDGSVEFDPPREKVYRNA